jgi:4-hydroxy-3-methylbut-2-enyl diphosphate reductase
MPEKLTVLLASPRGFCAGVERAIEIVERALERYGPPVYVRHEIVHNKHVVDSLRHKGAVFVEEVDDIPAGAHAIFSAHGVAASVVEAARERKLEVVDATCPLVSKVHKEGQNHVKKGRQVILIGHAGHPEVEGTKGQIPGGVLLVNTVEDVETLDVTDPKQLSYVTQTTLSVDDTRDVITALKKRFPEIVGPDVKDVVGAQNSSNSNRLRDLGAAMGKPSYLIADAGDFNPAWLSGVAAVGLTAGASAPEELVQGVILKLSEFRDVEVRKLSEIEENITFKLPRELLHPDEIAGAAD